jgi:hypothetical protein
MNCRNEIQTHQAGIKWVYFAENGVPNVAERGCYADAKI